MLSTEIALITLEKLLVLMLDKPESVKVAILIPSHNRNSILEHTLMSILEVKKACAENDYEVQIVIIDDFSAIPIQDYPGVKLIRSEKQLGESGAVNLGWAETDARYVAVVSDDDPQPRDWLSKLILIATQNPGYGVYYPSTLEVTGDGVVLKETKARAYNRNVFQRLLRCPVLAGALIDREKLNGLTKTSPRINVAFPSDLIQWLRFSQQTDFFPCPQVYSHWVRSEIQNTNYYTSTVAANALVESTIEWAEIEEVPLPILIGIAGRVFQFNSLHFFQSYRHGVAILGLIKKQHTMFHLLIELVRTAPYIIKQLFKRKTYEA
jgi:glycosyltransferase involved in cell wall biosynthesis